MAARREQGTWVNASDERATIVVNSDGSAISAGGGGGTSSVDDAAFTVAVSSLTPVGGIVTADSVDAGDVGAFAMLANRQQKITLYDSSGVEITSFGGGTEYTDDTSTHATGTSKGGLLMAAATPTDASVNANDIGAVAMTTDRKLHVSVQDALPAGTNAIGKLAANSGVTIGAVELAAAQTLAAVTTITNVVHVDDNGGALTVDNGGTFAVQATVAAGATTIAKAEDVASADADVGVPAMAVRKATPANTSGTDGDYEMLQMSAGRLWASATIDAALPAGANAIGKLAANSGVDIGDVDVTSITPGSGATNLGKAEDAAHSSGDVGVMALAVRKDSQAALAGTDGDYIPLTTDANGALYVTGGGGGTQYVEDAAAAADPTGTAVNLIRADTPAGVVSTDGDNVAQRGSNYGAAYVTLLDSGGSFVSVGGGTQYDEDTAHVSGDKLTMAGVVRQDTATALSGTDGDRTALITDASGRLHVNVGTGSVTANAGTNLNTSALALESGGNLATLAGAVRAEDAASADAHTGIPALAVRKGTPANTSGTDGDYEMLQMSAGRLWVDPSGVTLTVASHAVTNAGTFAVQDATVEGAIKAEDAAHSSGDSGIMALAVRASSPTDRSAGPTDGDYEPLGVNEVGALWGTLTPSANGGCSTFMASGSDGSSILVATAQAVKASAGNVWGYYVYNPEAAVTFVHFYNTASGSVTVGTTNPLFTIAVPAGAAANVGFPYGIAFSTAITVAATTTAGGNTAPATGASLVVWYK